MATDDNDNTRTSVAVSFNMHGYNQGLLKNLSKTLNLIYLCFRNTGSLLLICVFKNSFTDYFAFGSSAMSSSVASGMLHGRPFGGVMTLISNNLRKYTETIYSDERFVIVKIASICLLTCIFRVRVLSID